MQNIMPDPKNVKMRVGLLIPSSNTVMEVDLYQNLPQYITVHTARMFLEETTASAERVMVEECAPRAAENIRTAKPHLVVFGCTSAGSIGGPEYDRSICSRLAEITAAPTVGIFSAVRDKLMGMAIKSVAVITPYNEDINSNIRKGFEKDGFQVRTIDGMGITNNFDLSLVSAEEIVEFAVRKLKDIKVDGIFISCSNFHATDAIPTLKEYFSVPIVTSNTAILDYINEFYKCRNLRH